MAKSCLKIAKENYAKYFNMESKKFDENKASEVFDGMEDKDRRIEVVKNIYNSLFESDKVGIITKEWIKGSGSVDNIIERYNKSHARRDLRIEPNSGKHRISYDTQKYSGELSIEYGGNGGIKSILEVLEDFNVISDEEWEAIDRSILSFNKKSGVREIEVGSLIINIGVKLFNEVVNPNKFIEFLSIIKPYSKLEKRRIQDLINRDYDNEAGYFNFIFMDTSILTIKEKRLKKILMNWIDGKGLDINKIEFDEDKITEPYKKGKEKEEEDKGEVDKAVEQVEKEEESWKESEKENKSENTEDAYLEKLKQLNEKEEELRKREEELDKKEEYLNKREEKLNTYKEKLRVVAKNLTDKEEELKKGGN